MAPSLPGHDRLVVEGEEEDVVDVVRVLPLPLVAGLVALLVGLVNDDVGLEEVLVEVLTLVAVLVLVGGDAMVVGLLLRSMLSGSPK